MANHNIPPLYAPTAVATSLGWVNPQTGEILVSHKGLEVENIINLHGIPRRDFVKVIARAQEDLAKKSQNKEKTPEPVQTETQVQETPVVETPAVEEKKDEPTKEEVEKETKDPVKTEAKKDSTKKKATTKKSTKTAE